MFSSIFGKRRSSPVGVTDNLITPPIPGPTSDDGFVLVDTLAQTGGLYPIIPGAAPHRPAQETPKLNQDQSFHYMQGVPFSLSKDVYMAANVNAFAIQIGDILAFSANKIKINNYDYDFSVEKSVLKECQGSM